MRKYKSKKDLQTAFDKGDSMQKLQIANTNSAYELQLTNRDFQYLEVLRTAYPILCANVDLREKMRRIAVLIPSTFAREKRVVEVMNDAQLLFLNGATIPPNLLRGAMNEDLMQNIQSLKQIKVNHIDEPQIVIMANKEIAAQWKLIAQYNPMLEPEKDAEPIEFMYDEFDENELNLPESNEDTI